MAAIGISVALSFAAALVLGPVVGDLIGVGGIFWLTAGFALLGMLVLATIVPTPERSCVHRDAQPVLSQLSGVLANGTLLRLDRRHLSAAPDHGQPVRGAAAVAGGGRAAGRRSLEDLSAGGAAGDRADGALHHRAAERAGQVRAVLIGAALALSAAMFGFAVFDDSLWVRGAAADGDVHGVQSAGGGAAVAGVEGRRRRRQGHGHGRVLQFAVHRRLPRRSARRLAHEQFGADAVYEARLLTVPGVEAAAVAPEEGVAHLKVDSGRVDWARLSRIALEDEPASA
jgi:hypothetical protein